MSCSLRSSQNYVWNTGAVLGKGATGAVYAGLHKATGESVAVKSFNHLSHLRPYQVQKREFEVLQKVNHENIVKLLAIEEEVESQHKVLIMELCTGGSLFNILDDPVNCYGLEETEFLLVLKHLAAGMKHLRDKDIMHRDLKPGNIMKFISEDGSSIYKLTDFGAARELEDDQQFMSLYGTEEYLHPDMYERAVLRKPAGKTFRANFDLWSIGVTLFHIGTGSLPFKPFGGRKNKDTMYRITTEKASGIICGVQHSDNGPIDWSENLPKTCLLSPACQELVKKLLAGLLECQPTLMWSFDQFFECVSTTLSHKTYHIFYVNCMRDITLYVSPNDSVNDLKQKLKSYTRIATESQLLLWNKSQVLNTNDITTSAENPILLLNSDPTKMKASPIMSSTPHKFPDLHVSITNCEQDAQLAKLSASMAYSMQRIISKCVLYFNLAKQTPRQVICFIDGNVKLLLEKQQACSHLYNSLKNQLHSLNTTTTNLKQLKEKYSMDSNNFENVDSIGRALQLFAKLSEYWNGLSRKMTSMSDKVNELNEKWSKEPIVKSCSNMASALTKSKYHCQKIKESWQTLHKDKASRILSVNEEQLHQLEKIKIENNCKKLTKLLFTICYPSLGEVTEKLEDWYTGAQVAIVQSDCLFKELAIFMSDCDQLQQCLNQVKEDEKRSWTVLLNSNVTTQVPVPDRRLQEPNVDKPAIDRLLQKEMNVLPPNLVREITRLREAHGRLWSALEENQAVINEFESLSIEPSQTI
ncbi:Serine/threonine-protein kinase TBK1 [Halotydeus destructor]|nr:Serine/threonine-protein kinase TBK1 [Halotydeus destructor]